MDIFSNFQVANECLLDKRRTHIFKRATQRVIKEGDVVVDAGTGTGILALFAAEAGASKVYACDIAEDILQQAKVNFTKSSYKEKIKPVLTNMNNFKLTNKVDVVIMEMLDTGLIAEQQGIAIKNLKKNGVIRSHTKLIPDRADSYIELVDYNYNFYGFEMPMIIQARNYGANQHIMHILSKPTLYNTSDFHKNFSTKISETITITASNDGTSNAVRLRTRIRLHQDLWSWGTSDMLMPVIIPMTKMSTKKGQPIHLRINYTMGEGFNNCKIALIQ